MADALLIALLLAFFALAVALVHGCDRIIGPDAASDLATEESEESEEDLVP